MHVLNGTLMQPSRLCATKETNKQWNLKPKKHSTILSTCH